MLHGPLERVPMRRRADIEHESLSQRAHLVQLVDRIVIEGTNAIQKLLVRLGSVQLIDGHAILRQRGDLSVRELPLRAKWPNARQHR